MSRLSRNWVMEVSQEDDNPAVFGPYTRATAESLRDKLNADIDARPEGELWLHASAYPIEALTVTDLRSLFDLKRIRQKA